MFHLPILDKLGESRNVLIAGAGGGFDIFSGLPLYFALKQQNKSVYLANWTFSEIHTGEGAPKQLSEHLFTVCADSKGESYFPERYLCEWFRSKGENLNIYCFTACGTQQLRSSYELLAQKLKLDTIILVDGGTDSLLRGDEEDLGTPLEDMTSMAAVDQLNIATKILACLGFGIDSHHGVCHAHVLNTIAEQTKNNGFLGAISLLKTMPEVKRFIHASRYVFSRTPDDDPSIVISSILSALDGEFGDYHATSRTEGSELFINPLMCLYWFFNLGSIANSVVYMDELKKANNAFDSARAIKSFPRRDALRGWKNVPF